MYMQVLLQILDVHQSNRWHDRAFEESVYAMVNVQVYSINNGTKRYENFERTRLEALLEKLSYGLDIKYININEIVTAVYEGLPDSVVVEELLELAAESLASRTVNHPDHSLLAGRVIAKKLQNQVCLSFSENIEMLTKSAQRNSRLTPLVSEELARVASCNSERLDRAIKKERDYEFNYFGIKTLIRSYLLRKNGLISETPQYLFMRVALGIHGDNIDDAVETYDLMSQRFFIHASPTLFNAGTDYNHLSSCFLLGMESDSIDGIYRTLHKAALISKASGGIGFHVHNIRGSGLYISGSNGTASGLVPMLKVFNDTARYVDQGGNKRPGAFAAYLEPWHSDVMDVLNLKKNNGKEEMRARDLFYGLWVPDLFMKRVKQNSEWSLFSPDTAPGLSECYRATFESLYESYEKAGKAVSKIKARTLWLAILESQTETGVPYILFKDSCNEKSNQKNLGTIKSSNLCCEIVEYSSPEETAVCNLGSLALPSFIKQGEELLEYDLEKLHSVTKVLVKNLNIIIDKTKYPIESAKYSNVKNRPVAVGVQGLADLFLELGIPFESAEAKQLNIQIFETIYHASLEMSIELAIREGPYQSFKGSPISQGIFQFDMWNHTPSGLFSDWNELKAKAKKFGVRNSLLVAPMPTASTSQILGFNECFEPCTSNIYNRRVLSGEFQVVNKYLLRDLIELGIWNSKMKNRIIMENGSIQNIACIPMELKNLYKTVWEIPQRTLIDLAADRGKFIDQLQSMNIFLQNPTFGKLTSSHFYAWEKGLKTGMYYLRTQAATRPIQFTVDIEDASKVDSSVQVDLSSLRRKPFHNAFASPQRALKDEVYNSNPEKKRKLVKYEGSLLPRDKGEQKQRSNESSDIFDSKPLACNILKTDPCDSCTG